MKESYYVEVVYSDESGFHFDVSVEGSENEISGILMMITRGVLMSSNAEKAVCYRSDGFDVCSYVK